MQDFSQPRFSRTSNLLHLLFKTAKYPEYNLRLQDFSQLRFSRTSMSIWNFLWQNLAHLCWSYWVNLSKTLRQIRHKIFIFWSCNSWPGWSLNRWVSAIAEFQVSRNIPKNNLWNYNQLSKNRRPLKAPPANPRT